MGCPQLPTASLSDRQGHRHHAPKSPAPRPRHLICRDLEGDPGFDLDDLHALFQGLGREDQGIGTVRMPLVALGLDTSVTALKRRKHDGTERNP